MKALTVRQPWATLIMANAKRIETRTRDTRHRGPLAIHAGSALPCRRGENVHYGPHWWVERDGSGLLLRSTRPDWWPYRLPLGALLGSVLLYQTRATASSEYAPPADEIPLGDHTPGRFGWYFASPQRIKPRSMPGRLGLWDVPDDMLGRES